jgi:hypothetical protein
VRKRDRTECRASRGRQACSRKSSVYPHKRSQATWYRMATTKNAIPAAIRIRSNIGVHVLSFINSPRWAVAGLRNPAQLLVCVLMHGELAFQSPLTASCLLDAGTCVMNQPPPPDNANARTIPSSAKVEIKSKAKKHVSLHNSVPPNIVRRGYKFECSRSGV